MSATIAERVAAGAAWLDTNRPGWEKGIDLGRLDISSCTRCILGQIYGGFNAAPLDVRWDGDDIDAEYIAADRGFDVWAELVEEELAADAAQLTTAWRELILARRAGAA